MSVNVSVLHIIYLALMEKKAFAKEKEKEKLLAKQK